MLGRDTADHLLWWERLFLWRAYWLGLSVLLGLLLVVAAFCLLARLPYFEIRRVVITGDVQKANVAVIRAHTGARVKGSFWNLNLLGTQKMFEQVPWVRHAIVHRQFPDTVRVQLEEQIPAAVWQSEGGGGYVNGFGEVFEADDADAPDDLPVLIGGDGQSARMMSMYAALEQTVTQQQSKIQELELSQGGLWRLEMEPGLEIELGRGSEQELQARLRHFFEGFPQIFPEKSAKEALQMIASADLRYQKGFSVKPRSGVAVTKVK